MKVVLNVAEKPSVAKEIVKFLSKGNSRKSFGKSQYNPIFEFEYTINNEDVLMRVTSVQGHVMTMEFSEPYNRWNQVTPDELFEAPIIKIISQDKHDIVDTIKQSARGIKMLALWLDCDREGENIAYEVVSIVTQEIPLPQSCIKRAHFSALTKVDIEHAIQNLGTPQLELSEAVEARQEIDLRLGAIFTRLQTMRLRNECPVLNGQLISWGPCQFPTLGFVVERHLDIENFIPEKYWGIDMKVNRPGGRAEFTWERKRLFDFLPAFVIYEMCLEDGRAQVISINKQSKSKWRPLPLSTIAFQKLASSKLKIDSDTSMNIAEKLYQKGLVSYPRTETDSFKSTINLRQLVEMHNNHDVWGEYAQEMGNGSFQWPRNGGHDDNSHPPIHPVKCLNKSQLQGDEWRVYELISRHFLASCSLDAKGYETKVKAYMGGELFECKGLEIAELNFLKVYPYQKWNEANLPVFVENEVFVPTSLMLEEHMTAPPSYLTEADLITIMDKSGIGTDATIHQHIKTIQDRKYAEKNPNGLFKPTLLGLALVVGYSNIGTLLHKPGLRAKMEKGMIDIAAKRKPKRQLIEETLCEMRDVFTIVRQKFRTISENVKTIVPSLSESRFSNNICYKCGGEGHLANTCDRQQVQNPPQLAFTNANAHRENKCFKCGGFGHFANACTGVKDMKENSGTCFKCGQAGHYANNCPGSGNRNGDGNRRQENNRKQGNKPGKTCDLCGVTGRHPNSSSCARKAKKRKKNQDTD